MIADVCIEQTDVSNVKVEEGCRSVNFQNPERLNILRIKVDGCVEMEGPRADWVLEKNQSAVIVELKGKNVEHAAEQVEATARKWLKEEKRCVNLAGIIIARQYPKASSSIQVKQNKFAKDFGGPLHVITHNPSITFEGALSFRGPCKSG